MGRTNRELGGVPIVTAVSPSAHNPKVAGSNPAPAIREAPGNPGVSSLRPEKRQARRPARRRRQVLSRASDLQRDRRPPSGPHAARRAGVDRARPPGVAGAHDRHARRRQGIRRRRADPGRRPGGGFPQPSAPRDDGVVDEPRRVPLGRVALRLTWLLARTTRSRRVAAPGRQSPAG